MILLMSISLIPLLVVGVSVRRDLIAMSETLATRSGNILVHKASTGLQRIVVDHARVLLGERQLLESTALLLASRIEGVLSGHAHMPDEETFTLGETAQREAAGDYFILHMGNPSPLVVDFSRADSEGPGVGTTAEHLIPLLGKVKFDYPGLILWLRVTLDDGTVLTYPQAKSGRMRGRGGMNAPQAMDGEGGPLQSKLAWTTPKVDPATRRMAFEVSAPIRDAQGALQGNLTLVIPVDSVLRKNRHVSIFSSSADALLVRPEPGAEGSPARVRIVAEEQSDRSGPAHWMVPESESWIEPTDPEQFGLMADSLLAGKPGVVGMEHLGGQALWAFSPMDENGTSLLIIVPKSDIVRDAQAARAFVEEQVDEHNSKMGFVALAVAVSVLLLSLFLSRMFTRNISELADSVRSVAKGNFAVRATIRSTDEVGQLGMAFNSMIPELKERVKLKNSLEVAQEVQQSLLPAKPPAFDWADVAATSSYCDETGGDYYGFIRRSSGESEGLIVAVGDVSGHGMQAALLMASVRAYLRGQLSGDAGLDEAVRRVNELITDDVEGTGRFMTLFLLELVDGGARWVRAGHDPALLFDPEAGTFEELLGDGLPLGVTHDVDFEVGSKPALKSGQYIIIGTDGIWEMHSPSGEMFGKERLKDLVRANAGQPARAIITALETALVAFRGQAGQMDDMTIAVVRRR
ncbi:PP2C family protein-serine/threonine phosphatase [Pseudodesulfovibrio indicus]|nr:SpoIIE family protein phosphatase [Pseudodesulfovibrio indicus]